MGERELADWWYDRVVRVQHGHYLAALHFDRRHWLLGGLNVVLAAAIGTTVFATLAEKADLLVVTGALSVIATLVSALNAYLAYGERAGRHRVAGARYGAVGRELELLLSRAKFDSEFDGASLSNVKEKLDALAQECPHIPVSVHKRMGKNPPRKLPIGPSGG